MATTWTPPPREDLDGGPDRARVPQLRRRIGSTAVTYQQIAVTYRWIAVPGRPGDLERAGDVPQEARRELLAVPAEDLRETPAG